MQKKMKILVVLPLYGGSLPVGRFCVQALKEIGHVVEVFEAPDFYGAYKALDRLRVTSDRLDYLHNSFLQTVSQAVLAKTETFEPDLVLALAQAPLTIQALKRLRRDKVVTAMWFVEDFRLFTYWQAFAPYYDIFAVIQKEPFFSQLSEIGQNNHLYLPLAAQPDFHKPLELSSIDKRKYGGKLSFMGAGYPNRRLAFRELVRYGLKIWGTEWDGDHVLEPLVQMGGARVSSEDCVKIFNATDINLNLHSSVHTEKLVPGGDFINPRTFELAACGAFQLVDEREFMAESFDENELATFTSMDELKEKIEYYESRPEERQELANKSRTRVLADHTYVARMQSLIDFTTQRIPDWPKAAKGEKLFGPDFPTELADEIKDMLEKLGLPADVGFDDLVWAVRQQQGVLTDLDTAILFLDEWKKLYVTQ